MTKDEALKLALEALELSAVTVDSFGVQKKTNDAIAAIKKALAQPEQEPVAWQWWGSAHFRKKIPKDSDTSDWSPLYRTPQRTWVGLTEEQFLEAARLAEDGNYLVAFQRIQLWLKEKNA